MNKLLIMLFLLSSNLVFAHGEDVAGPNGGFIKMPGSFHTEIVPEGKNKLKVFLLDMKWENPLIADSKVTLTYVGKINEQVICQPQQNYFTCEFSKNIDINNEAQLKVLATRNSQKGGEVTYMLPLKITIKNDDHSSHH